MTASTPYYRVTRRRTLVRSQRWGWTLWAANHKKIATSGEGYSDRAEALKRFHIVVGGSCAEAVLR